MKPLKIILAIVCFVAGLCAALAQYSPLPAPGYPGITTVMRPGVGQRVFSGNVGLTNAFFSAISGDVITVGPGTYTIEAKKNSSGGAYGGLQVSNVNGLTISGYGATIRTTNYGTMLSLSGCSNVTIAGLTFVGEMNNVTNYTNASWTIEGAIWTVTNAVNKVGKIRITDCNFRDIPDQAISFICGAWDCEVTSCRFENIGRTNNLSGGVLPDGACISGLMMSGRVVGNTATRVLWFFESDGDHYPYGGGAVDGLVIGNNTVRELNWQGIWFNPAGSGTANNCVRNVYIENNLFEFASNDYRDHRSSGGVYHTGIGGNGAWSNSVIRGNTIVGLTNYTSPTPSQQIWLANSYGPVRNILIDGNRFLSSGTHAIVLSYNAGPATMDNITIVRNVFQDVYFPMRFFCGQVRVEDNEFSAWASGTDYGGNTIGTLYLTSAASITTNIIYGSNVHTPTNAACRTVSKIIDCGMDYVDNKFRGLAMTTPIYSSVTMTNLFFREIGAGAPTLACKPGSIFFRTDASTVGNLYVQTNAAGLNGWRNNAN